MAKKQMIATITMEGVIQLLTEFPGQNLLLAGPHGVGKTSVIKQAASRLNLHYLPLLLGQLADPGDLTGIPMIRSDRTHYAAPSWWPSDDRPVLVHLDELNRGRPELMNAVMQLALEGEIFGRRLPKGSICVACVNHGDEYSVNSIDPALLSRFNLFTLTPTVDEWIAWARGAEVDRRVVAYIEEHPTHLDPTTITDDLAVSQNRRAWVRVGATHPTRSLTGAAALIAQGAVGPEMAQLFHEWVRKQLTYNKVIQHKLVMGQPDQGWVTWFDSECLSRGEQAARAVLALIDADPLLPGVGQLLRDAFTAQLRVAAVDRTVNFDPANINQSIVTECKLVTIKTPSLVSWVEKEQAKSVDATHLVFVDLPGTTNGFQMPKGSKGWGATLVVTPSGRQWVGITHHRMQGINAFISSTHSAPLAGAELTGAAKFSAAELDKIFGRDKALTLPQSKEAAIRLILGRILDPRADLAASIGLTV